MIRVRLYARALGDSQRADAALAIDLPPGDAGVACTIAAMRAMAHDAAEHPTRQLVEKAQVLRDTRERSGVTYSRGAVWLYLRDAYRFRSDPSGVEHVRSPALQGATIEADGFQAADCDDLAVYAAALLLLAGERPAFVTQAKRNEGPRGLWRHVFPAVIDAPQALAEWMRAHPEGAPPPVPGVYPLDAQERIDPGQWPITERVGVWPL